MTVLKTSPTLRPKELAISAIGATGIYNMYHSHVNMCLILGLTVYPETKVQIPILQPASTAVLAG